MSGLPDDPFAALRSTGQPGTCNPFALQVKRPGDWGVEGKIDQPASSGFSRLEEKLDLLLVEIMELRRLLSTAPIDPEEG